MKHDEIENGLPVIDLLYPDGKKRELMKRRRYAIAESSKTFSDDLMLDQLAKIICGHNTYKMLNILQELTDDEEIINFRLDILDDMLNVPELAAVLRKIISIMITNDKGNLYNITTPDSFTALDAAVTAFEAYIQCMELMHEFSLKNRQRISSAGITRLLDFFDEKYADKHYKALCGEIKELRETIKNRIKSVTVAINLDENLVPVSAGIVELSNEKYCMKPSLLDKIIYHGAKFSDKTVMDTMHERYIYENNDSRSKDRIADTAEKALFQDLDRITKKYVNLVEEALDEYQAIGFKEVYAIEYQLDFYMGVVKLIESARAKGLEMCRPKILPPQSRRAEIEGLFDPVYFCEANIYNLNHTEKRSVVPNDIALDENAGFYILTGANNGGKTTFVRALGICQVMAQAGLYVPAAKCEISVCDCVYTHFPKEEQKGIDSSRFTTEIKEFKQISDVITNHSLLLMNESIQSTTPSECVDIASQLVRIFAVMGVRGIFATHLVDIAAKADELNKDPMLKTKLGSLVVSVDENTGERLYKIIKGKPSDTSYAGSVFEKFGLDIEALQNKAKKFDW